MMIQLNLPKNPINEIDDQSRIDVEMDRSVFGSEII